MSFHSVELLKDFRETTDYVFQMKIIIINK